MAGEIKEDINYALDDYDEDYIQITDEVEEIQEEVKEVIPDPVIPEQPTKVNIEGLGEFTVDEIKEFKQGYMRQSDYTRKTQELAKQRKELEQAPIYSTPQGSTVNPAIYTDPVIDRISKLEQEIANKELDSMLTNLKSTYPDFDEVEVLNTAYKMGVTDLEFVYKATRKEKADATTNETALKEQIRQELLQELKETRDSTSTIITGEGSVNVSVPQLSRQELMIAKNMGLTPEEYAQYK